MKAKTHLHLIERLKQFGAEANVTDPGEIELRSATTVSVPMPLLDELLDALVDGVRARGRPRGRARLSHHAFLAAAVIRELGGDKKELVKTLSENAGLDKAQTRTLHVMVNEHLRRDQGSWEEVARKRWKLIRPI